MLRLSHLASVLLLVALPGAGAAKTLRDVSGPAETPPASFAGTQYVDSAGCVFVKAGYAGNVTWVPRVTKDRQVVCGQKPSLAATAAPPAATAAETATASAAPVVAPRKAAPKRTAPASVPAARAKAPTAAVVEPAGGVTLVSVTTVSTATTQCSGKSTTAQRYALSDGRSILRCGAPVADPVAYLNRLGLDGLRVTGKADDRAAGPVRAASAVPAGYKPAWHDGRLNPARGPSGATQPASSAPLAAPAPAAANGARYIQVGAFAVADNAASARARIAALGLAVARKDTRIGGRGAEIVLAGPFASAADARSALLTLRNSGFPDAFLR